MRHIQQSLEEDCRHEFIPSPTQVKPLSLALLSKAEAPIHVRMQFHGNPIPLSATSKQGMSPLCYIYTAK